MWKKRTNGAIDRSGLEDAKETRFSDDARAAQRAFAGAFHDEFRAAAAHGKVAESKGQGGWLGTKGKYI